MLVRERDERFAAGKQRRAREKNEPTIYAPPSGNFTLTDYCRAYVCVYTCVREASSLFLCTRGRASRTVCIILRACTSESELDSLLIS